MRRKDRELLETKEIVDIINQCKTCHVAMVDEGEPYVIPLSFGYEVKDSTLILYLHSAKEGRKIDIWNKNSRVCFEMSCEGESVHAKTPCDSGYYFSSLIGYGNVEFIEDIGEKCKALSLLMKHQANQYVEFNEVQANSVCVFKIVSSELTGKKKSKPQNK
ncbi:MAG: pyridoxamine 5'-phosphate oxidase family protein [Lachnotalea sp.]